MSTAIQPFYFDIQTQDMVKYNILQSLIKVAGGNGKGNNWYKNIK
jgi:hypothetical protein